MSYQPVELEISALDQTGCQLEGVEAFRFQSSFLAETIAGSSEGTDLRTPLLRNVRCRQATCLPLSPDVCYRGRWARLSARGS